MYGIIYDLSMIIKKWRHRKKSKNSETEDLSFFGAMIFVVNLIFSKRSCRGHLNIHESIQAKNPLKTDRTLFDFFDDRSAIIMRFCLFFFLL